MMPSTPWLLPEYIEDVLPGEAATLEYLRRSLLDHLAQHGYQWVHPPLIEYLDTLLTGTGQDLGPRTFKVVDQRSGKTMGVRADITPQVARIDTHLFATQALNRLCYCGTVLHTQPSVLHDSREIWQLGAELYGSSHVAADTEVVQLLLELTRCAGLTDIYLDIGHVGLFETLTEDLSESLREPLFEALQSKDLPQLRLLTKSLDAATQSAFLALAALYGEPRSVLERARAAFANFPAALIHIEYLDRVLSQLNIQGEQIRLDLAELRGYNYHTGLVFALYTPTQHRAIGLGGRYDRLGHARGCVRPATGFSLDLRALAACIPARQPEYIVAPYQPSDLSLKTAIKTLRNSGRYVWEQLPITHNVQEDTNTLPPQATHRLELINNQWQVTLLS